ncbi:hypothetical protein [Pedobacter sp. SYSU D00535]|uniref:hypothetical protein n=1 Tax=Pedobacter sp. SYSU D00535 TaxID=2810308 RepID=UPI001A95B354|nr:hypothetical protein [Pedobacter sp. SYSU D00535]
MKLENNDLVKGASGRIGDMLVFRQQAGRTIIAKRPRKRETPRSDGQIVANERFAEAVQYARGIVQDEARKAIYQQKTRRGISAYNLALSDYCKAPQIKKVDLSQYSGAKGSLITIRATDDFLVKAVRVEILDSTMQRQEEGEAILAANNLDWVYTGKLLNPAPASSTIRVSASDLPGNITTQDYSLMD